jgi:hypothetical protein
VERRRFKRALIGLGLVAATVTFPAIAFAEGAPTNKKDFALSQMTEGGLAVGHYPL